VELYEEIEVSWLCTEKYSCMWFNNFVAAMMIHHEPDALIDLKIGNLVY
jgi:hypothetical protein